LTLYETSKLGIKYIKTSIDRAVNYTQNVEKDTSEIASRVKKLFRTIIMAAEERERTILEELEKIRLGKSSSLNDQMTGLRSALAGMAELSEDLSKAIEKFDNLPKIEIASILVNSDNNIGKYKSMYNNLLPTEDVINFVQKHPHFEILEEIRKQGELCIGPKNAQNFSRHPTPVNSSTPPMTTTNSSISSLQDLPRSSNSPSNGSNQISWMNPSDTSTTTGSNGQSSLVTSTKTYASIVKPTTITTSAPFGQAIPGINKHVRIRPAAAPSK
jgi:tripartite motif-containing protein 71